MASALRTFGTEISENRQRKTDLKPEVRAAICASVAAGQKKTAVAKAFGVTRQTVYDTLDRHANLQTFESKLRIGRPRILSDREERYLVQIARRFPKISWRSLVELHGAQVSKRTVQRILQHRNL